MYCSYHCLVKTDCLVMQTCFMKCSLGFLTEFGRRLDGVRCQYDLFRLNLCNRSLVALVINGISTDSICQFVGQSVCLTAACACANILYVPHRYFLLNMSKLLNLLDAFLPSSSVSSGTKCFSSWSLPYCRASMPSPSPSSMRPCSIWFLR